MSKKANIKELIFDTKNFNTGTQFGKHLMDKSLSKFGAGRSILIDKNNRIIAGNKTTEAFAELGFENVEIVETDGKTLIAVKRNDIDLDTEQGREFAIADNATALKNISFDFEVLEEEMEKATIEEWGLYEPETEDQENDVPTNDNKMTFALAKEQATQIRNALDKIKTSEEFKYVETFGNEDSDGNALYLIIMQWLGI